MDRSRSWLLVCHEILFALNLALVIVDEAVIQARSALLDYLAYPIWGGLYYILSRVYVKPHFHLGRRFEFFALWVFLAGVFIVLFRLLGKTPIERLLLRAAPGLVAACAIPAYWLQVEGLGSATSRWLLAELLVVCFFTALYLSGAWRPDKVLSMLVISMHFGLWGFVTYIPSRSWYCAIYPLLGLSSMLVWGSYLNQVQERRMVL